MGRNNRQRRAAKAKARARAGAERARTAGSSSGSRADDLLREVVELRLGGHPGAAVAEARLAAHHLDVALAAELALERRLPDLWAHGWQPAEVVRQADRVSARAGRVVALAVLADHARRERSTLDPRWAAQVDALGTGGEVGGWFQRFARMEGLDPAGTVALAVDALVVCFDLVPIDVLIPPPGAGAVAAGSAPAGVSDDVLAKVRALLAKAESTTFEAEAVAFTAKAQELMARHAVDHARLWDERGRDERPVAVRLPVDDPYATAKSSLLHVVAERNRCRAVRYTRYGMSAVVGFAADLAATELLFTSLLVQSQVALEAESAGAAAGARVRSRRFRSSFLLAYAQRIGARLAAVNTAIDGDAGALLPVLVARSSAVDDEVAARFGRLRSSRSKGEVDALGWARGAQAADRAELAKEVVP